MSTITMRDDLRQAVELASGGTQTVRFTAKGQPSFFNIVKKFDLSTIDSTWSGTHPAFIVGGVEKSQILIGTYQGVVIDGELVSQPNKNPTGNMTLSAFITAAQACGAGHHVITNAEWSAVALQQYINKTQPQGNTYYGVSADDNTQIGVRVDGLQAGVTTSGVGRTYTGSGPVSWRTENRYNGISDLAGNGNEMVTGFRIVAGELQFLQNNDAALSTINTQTWLALDGATGAFVPAGSANSVKYANSGTTPYTLVQATNFSAFANVTNPSATPVTTVALNKLKALLAFPMTNQFLLLGTDIFGFSGTETRLALRGGGSTDGLSSGIFYLGMTLLGSGLDVNVYTRPAMYE